MDGWIFMIVFGCIHVFGVFRKFRIRFKIHFQGECVRAHTDSVCECCIHIQSVCILKRIRNVGKTPKTWIHPETIIIWNKLTYLTGIFTDHGNRWNQYVFYSYMFIIISYLGIVPDINIELLKRRIDNDLPWFHILVILHATIWCRTGWLLLGKIQVRANNHTSL